MQLRRFHFQTPRILKIKNVTFTAAVLCGHVSFVTETTATRICHCYDYSYDRLEVAFQFGINLEDGKINKWIHKRSTCGSNLFRFDNRTFDLPVFVDRTTMQ